MASWIRADSGITDRLRDAITPRMIATPISSGAPDIRYTRVPRLRSTLHRMETAVARAHQRRVRRGTAQLL